MLKLGGCHFCTRGHFCTATFFTAALLYNDTYSQFYDKILAQRHFGTMTFSHKTSILHFGKKFLASTKFLTSKVTEN